MPLIHVENSNPQCSWGIWEIKESSQELIQALSPRSSEAFYLNDIEHEAKKSESTAARLVIKKLLELQHEEYMGILKGTNGKPYLADGAYRISLSHTENYAVGIIHTSKEVGIDIERVQGKLLKIAKRILSKEEQKEVNNNLEKITVYWSAKETLYKIHSKGQLFFNSDLLVSPFRLAQRGELQSFLRVNGTLNEHTLHYYCFNKDYYICFGQAN
ncbi:4'-phosphopantetheinyl transferase family protein [Microscilla marina]|uniref:4'-phosphopantetheinyl transferase superfamily n=1 Tax=Microscilla marina ATCC 23134 TaxID=313606 RepID=A1ZKM7_MICM2|nr:4'-phosphopantetheinyl transferase superfamily protein [Microscilla marina]EAY29253.1 4'-phosphopantetheinyl transferase superfamily [Microscilla marina ATCC 23134]